MHQGPCVMYTYHMTLNLYIGHLLYMSHNNVYMYVIIIHLWHRDLLISIAITLAIKVFLYCTYTPKTLSIELVKVIRMILCSYK